MTFASITPRRDGFGQGVLGRRGNGGKQSQGAVGTFGHRGKAVDPVATIDVEQPEILMHGGDVKMAADHAIMSPRLGQGDQAPLVAATAVEQIAYRRKRPFDRPPVIGADAQPHPPQTRIRKPQQTVRTRSDPRQHVKAQDARIADIAMQNQIAAPIGRHMLGAGHGCHGQGRSVVLPPICKHKAVVVAGQVDQPRPGLGPLSQKVDDLHMRLAPAPDQWVPEVEYIADQIDHLGGVLLQKLQDQVGPAADGAQMQVRKKQRPMAVRLSLCPTLLKFHDLPRPPLPLGFGCQIRVTPR